jgi:hypothetical protein
MKKTVLATAALAVVIATPAFAQSYDPDLGSGNIVPYYGQTNPNHGRTVRRAAPSDAYARTPYDAFARTPRVRNNGPRSPYAQYDTDGNLIDENMPGRW